MDGSRGANATGGRRALAPELSAANVTPQTPGQETGTKAVWAGSVHRHRSVLGTHQHMVRHQQRRPSPQHHHRVPQTAFPNSGMALYGPYSGSVGRGGQRYRLRLFYSGGAAGARGGRGPPPARRAPSP